MERNFSFDLHRALGSALEAADNIRGMEFDIAYGCSAAPNLRRAREALERAQFELAAFERAFLKADPAPETVEG